MEESYVPEQIVFFDGICHFCQGSVQFIMKHNSEQDLYFASLQSEVAQKLLGHLQLPDSIIFYSKGKIYTESDAILEIAKHLDFPFKLAVAFRIVPQTFRNWLYKQFARRRYSLFGRASACIIPSSTERARFLELA